MTLYFVLLAVGVSFLCSLVASAVLMLLGGYGGYRLTTKALLQLNDELIRLDDKLTREVKTRAGLASKEKAKDTSEADKILELAKNKIAEGGMLPLDPYRQNDRAAIVRKAKGY